MFIVIKLLWLGIFVFTVESTLEVEPNDKEYEISASTEKNNEVYSDLANESENQHVNIPNENRTNYQHTPKNNSYEDDAVYDDGNHNNYEDYDAHENFTNFFDHTIELTTLTITERHNESEETTQKKPTPRGNQPLLTNPAGIINYNNETLPSCPAGFISHNEQGLFGMCSFITEPTAFPPACPYPNTINFYEDWFQIAEKKIVWLPAKRNLSDGFGSFEWLKTPKPHARLELDYREQNKSVADKNCLVLNIDERRPVPTNCSDKYPAFCLYNYYNLEASVSAFSYYCRRRYNESCVSNDLSVPLKCYCKSIAQAEKQSRETFCKKLVGIEEPSMNHLLINLLHDNERCWIGLREGRNSYQWASTNTTSNYTFWSSNVDFRKRYGALSRSGWLLEEDEALACAICEIKVEDHPQVQLHLRHNKTSNTLQVEINNAIEVFESVTCFKDSSKDYISRNISDNTDSIIYLKLPFNTTGYCWCVALQIPNLTPVYSNTILITNTGITYGNVYALSTTSRQKNDSHLDHADEQACKNIANNLSEIISFSRPIKIINFSKDEENIEVLCHLNTKPSNYTITQEFEILSKLLKNTSANATSLASIQVCLPSTTISGSQTLHWPETPTGATTIPQELCIQQNGVPVTRTCAGNFYYGSRWLDVNGTCANVTYSPRTHLLNELLRAEELTPSALDESLFNSTKDTQNITSLDIYLVSKLFEKLTDFAERISIDHTAKLVDNIMHFDRNQLQTSQEILNATDMVLYNLDDMLAATEVNDSGYATTVTEKLVVQINDLKKTDIIGIKLGKEEGQKGFDSSGINSLHQGISQQDLQKENFDLALMIPQQLREDIINCIGPDSSPNLISTVFYDDVLFSEQQNTSNHAEGRIIGVTIPGFNCNFNTPFQVIFKPPSDNTTQLKCASWLYGFNERMESIHGQWFIEGDPKTLGNSTYQVCEFTHVTHFTLLVLGGSNTISEGHKKALDIITAVGSGLSILGLLVVFLTAIVFRSFRSANAVVINFSIAMTAQIVLLFTADNVAENKGLCVAFGAALHYIVLVQFFWMLTIAIMQYKRYVLVFASPTTHLALKTCAFSWGIPLIPVIVILSISTDNYGENSHGLCYALGNYFIFGVLVPVCIILFVNLLLFLRIMLSIASSSRIKAHRKKEENPSLQLKLAIMLYFLLGLTWGFGLLAAIGAGVVYAYLFCLTATLQGFILFLYFIVLNEKTRSLWTNMKTCCKKSDDYEASRDSSGMPMVRRPKNTKTSETNTDSTTSEMLRRIRNRSSSDF